MFFDPHHDPIVNKPEDDDNDSSYALSEAGSNLSDDSWSTRGSDDDDNGKNEANWGSPTQV